MKIEIEIPDYIDKKLLTEDLITEMKISAYIPLIEKGEMNESAIARFLDISLWETSDYFTKIKYTGHLKVNKELDNDPELKEYEEKNRKILHEYLLKKIKEKEENKNDNNK